MSSSSPPSSDSDYLSSSPDEIEILPLEDAASWGGRVGNYHGKHDDSSSDRDSGDSSDDDGGEVAEARRVAMRLHEEIPNEAWEAGLGSIQTPSSPPSAYVSSASSDLPSLESVLTEMEKSLEGVKARSNAFESAPSSSAQRPPGWSYLSVKYHLLLHYSALCAFYVLCRAEGADIKGHPVVEALIRTRMLLEKLKPLDARLAPQLARLQKLANGGVGKNGDEALAHRARVENLVSRLAEDDVDGEDEYSSKGTSNIYKPPKLQPRKAPTKESESSKAARELSRSEAYIGMMEEYGDAPISRDTLGGSNRQGSSKSRDEEKARKLYEEETYRRLAVGKKTKSSGTEVVEDGWNNGIDKIVASSRLDGDRQRESGDREVSSLSHHRLGLKRGADIGAGDWGETEKRHRGGDDDVKPRDHKRARDAVQAQKDHRSKQQASSRRSTDAGDAEALAMYANAVQGASAKRDSKHDRKHTGPLPSASHTLESGVRRTASREVVKNRGLTKYRRSDKANPRVVHRERYRKAEVVQRSSLGKGKRGDSAATYAGEKTGIRTKVVRSRELH